MEKVVRKLAACCLLLFAFAGNAYSQGSDGLYVIKKTNYNNNGGEHYLAHVKVGEDWVLQDATEFSPNCLWYSGREFNLMGTHHNYYFMDENDEPRFLMAPLAEGGDLLLSTTKPPIYLLNNTDQDYYFYDWDYDNRPEGAGVARGHQYNGILNEGECDLCEGGKWDDGDSECWAVYWVECNGDNEWKLSTVSQYNITEKSGRFRQVTVQQFPLEGEGGLNDLQNIVMEYGNSQSLSASITTFSYIPAYKKYEFVDVTDPGVQDDPETPENEYVAPTTVHRTYYFPNNGTNTNPPTSQVSNGNDPTQWSYNWSISGEGAEYLTLTNGNTASPTLAYSIENTTGHKTATLTLTVTYQDGSSQTTSCTVTVKTPCQNPSFSANVTYEGVIVSWTPTAESYTVSWRLNNPQGAWVDVENITTTSYTINVNDLEYGTTYDYKVKANCTTSTENPEPQQFTTLSEPIGLVYGAVFGGGRMADVGGNTTVVIINTDSISAVYGGNDIAGEVQGADGSTIILGIDAEVGSNSYSQLYNNGNGSTKVRVFDVYGGGNGYYLYNDTISFVGATSPTAPVGNNHSVKDLDGNIVWTNNTGNEYEMTIPTIIKTAITVTNDKVKVDSIFGGAKNAFITNSNADANGTSITVNGGIAYAVFGGNNYGGTQTDGKHHVEVNATKTHLATNIASTETTGYGRDFGIRYVFGGGNKVEGKETDVLITGGQCDTVFGGGNAADVTKANIEVNCSLGAHTGDYVYGNIYTNAINSSFAGTISDAVIDDNYTWTDTMGVYNTRVLFGGNNRAPMHGLPTITLTSGSIGTVYGGGNAGKMLAQTPEDPTTKPLATDFDPPMVGTEEKGIFYSTHVVMNSDNMLVDNLYGGCQMSDVLYSTWVEMQKGHVGIVYGGCNISGDVGSEPRIPYNECDTDEKYQLVNGGTYVKASGGTIYKGLFAGSNGYYHCNDGLYYIDGVINLGHYIGELIPTHNETHVMVSGDVLVKGDVYAGGNLAYVGFINETDQNYRFRDFVGYASVRMDGGTVEGSVYGGGCRASVFGSNEVRVSGGSIGYINNEPTGGALYGGNDRSGQVAQITNRVLPSSYDIASDGHTSLTLLGVKTYVGVTGKPRVNTVYGGGNGDYVYTEDEYCDVTDQPVQSNTFVDINIDAAAASGQETGGYIHEVYGGGNGVTVLDHITVLLNVVNANNVYDHVGTIFGGNNKGSLDILSDIILLHGQVHTVYGGCNKGAMLGALPVESGDGLTGYENVGSFVRLRNEYTALGGNTTVIPDAVVSGEVYGGCRMNGVTNNSLVLVEGGLHPNASIFGGSDISGNVGGLSQVVVTAGTHTIGEGSNAVPNGPIVGNVFGGGNGNYTYEGNKVYTLDSPHVLIDTIPSGTIERPYCDYTRVDMLGGTAANIYGGGNAAGVNYDALVNVDGGAVTVGVYGGCCSFDAVQGDINVNIMGGALGVEGTPMTDGIYGGGYGAATEAKGNVTVTVGDGSHNPTIYGDVYGGSALGQVNDAAASTPNLTFVDFQNGSLHGNLYGGGKGSSIDSTLVNGNVQVDITGGNLYDNIYGGCNRKGGVTNDITINVNGGVIGTNAATANVFGGGYGHSTGTSGNVTVNFDKVENVDAPVIYGDVYGGSGFGDVNADSDDATIVNILDGFLRKATNGNGGDIYGGGLGDPDNPAHVNGIVFVNIGSGEEGPDGCAANITGNATIEGAVYGCNNVNGTPLDSVFVNIYKTAHGTTPQTNLYPDEDYPTGYTEWSIEALAANAAYQTYAISAVYGGGNKAAYLPPLNADNTPKCTTVHVWACKKNTIREVYGGGNAADVGSTDDPETEEDETLPANTRVIIDGGRIHQNFGGGNGYSAATPPNHTNPNGAYYNPGANIYGTASSYIYAGLIDEVYGGANQWGSIDVIDLNVMSKDCCDDETYGKVFGCANEAPLNHSVTTTIGCPVGEIGELYGGSNLADIGSEEHFGANVTLNVYGGQYESVFGGSKGQVDGNKHADIYGNVTLNIYGGEIVKAFGGSDQLGNVFGTITVNVDTIPGCAFQLDTVFGAGNVTYYTPYQVDDELITGPIVNIINGTVRKAVFGGGKGATAITTANPQVNIGVVDNTQHSARLARVGFNGNDGDVYGGGFEGAVLGGPVVNVRKDDQEGSNTIIYHNLYGGGDMASVDSTQVNVYDGTIISGVYGGCNVQGAVTKDIAVNIYGGVLGNEEEDMTEGIFGGGLGEQTTTGGDVTVTIGGTGYNPDIYGYVYGGSALGSVNFDTDNLTKVQLNTGTVHGYVFGGGLGQKNGVNGATSNIEAYVHGNIQVVGDGTDVTTAVFGCNNLLGDPDGTVSVTINDGTIGNVFGGGSLADYSAPVDDYPYVHIHGGTVLNKVVGGGNEASITGSTYIFVDGGTIGTSTDEGAGIYGGCNTTGTVTGNTTVLLTGGTVGVSDDNTANIFGGGYGEPTRVTGNILVQFGTFSNDTLAYPMLFGELYGGSALGNVNTSGSNTTTVNIYNGTIDGAVYGGGLGRQASSGVAAVEAKVYGRIQVNIGAEGEDNEYIGKATLIDCDVFGCNNQNGSPQDSVRVDVYQTAHIVDNEQSNYDSPFYAIHQVFGGGNQSDYDTLVVRKNNIVYVHGCENTIWRLFGGGNAAYVYGVGLTIDGGRFDEVFGGGNGELGPAYAAHIASGGINILIGGGRINSLYNGSNQNGNVYGPIEMSTFQGCNDGVIIDHFMGSNHTEIVGDITENIPCGSEMKFVNLYCGSNVAQIYGSVNLTIGGGIFENVFGGSKGRKDHLTLPDYASNIQDNPVTDEIEGHVTLMITGGTIGNLYGACDLNGNVTGRITLTIQENADNCGLFIGNIYGGGRYTDYTPSNINNGSTEYPGCTPVIKVLKATVGGTSQDLPVIPVYDEDGNPVHRKYEGNVYGGGYYGDVTSNPIVIIGDKDHPNSSPVNIEGNVYGGGKVGAINGNTKVVILPTE